VIPKTEEEAEKIEKRGEKTKEVLFNDLKKQVEEAIIVYPRDDYLKETNTFLLTKSFKSFNPKSRLSNLVLEVDEHMDYLNIQNSLRLTLDRCDNDSDVSSDGE
jgi:hypothetical protein